MLLAASISFHVVTGCKKSKKKDHGQRKTGKGVKNEHLFQKNILTLSADFFKIFYWMLPKKEDVKDSNYSERN